MATRNITDWIHYYGSDPKGRVDLLAEVKTERAAVKAAKAAGRKRMPKSPATEAFNTIKEKGIKPAKGSARTTTRKGGGSRREVSTKLTDDEVLAALRRLVDETVTSPGAAVKAFRASGRSAGGARIRAAFAQLVKDGDASTGDAKPTRRNTKKANGNGAKKANGNGNGRKKAATRKQTAQRTARKQTAAASTRKRVTARVNRKTTARKATRKGAKAA